MSSYLLPHEDYPLDKFVDRVEHQRQWVEATHTPSLGRVKPEKKNYPLRHDTSPETHTVSPNDLSQSNATSRESSEVNEIKTQIKDLTEQLGKLQTSPRQPQKERYCSHCHFHSHDLKEWWRKPSRGSCFIIDNMVVGEEKTLPRETKDHISSSSSHLPNYQPSC